MEIGHGNIEFSIRSTIDMRVADSSLISDGIARNDGFSIVDSRKSIAVVADGHKQSVRWVVEIGEEIGAHVLLGKLFLFLSFCISPKSHDEC